MKFVLSLVALSLVAAVNAAPAPVFAEGGKLDKIQDSLEQIAILATDLNTMEERLGVLEDAKDTIVGVQDSLAKAVDTDGYTYKNPAAPAEKKKGT